MRSAGEERSYILEMAASSHDVFQPIQIFTIHPATYNSYPKFFKPFIQQGFNYPPSMSFLFGQTSTEQHFSPPLEEDIGFNDVVPNIQHNTLPISLVQVVPQISDNEEHLLAPRELVQNTSMHGRRNKLTA